MDENYYSTTGIVKSFWESLLMSAILIVAMTSIVTAQPISQADKLQEAQALHLQIIELCIRGDCDLTLPLAERELSILEDIVGRRDDPRLLQFLVSLGLLYQGSNDYNRAESIFRRILDILETVLGPNHSKVAIALNNLALLYQAEGEYARAEPLLERSLNIREAVPEPDHHEVAIALNNLAELYRLKGDYPRAEQLFLRSLEIEEKHLGPNDPSLPTTLNNLAELYRLKGDYPRAEQLFLRSIEILGKTLGQNHPRVGIAFNNLAGLYLALDDYDRAEPLFQKSLGILEKTTSNYQELASTLNNLAALYQFKNEWDRAETFFQRSVKITEKLGPDHPQTGLILGNLASFYHAKRDYAKAESLYHQSLGTTEKALGPNHPHVALMLNNMGVLALKQGKTAECIATVTRGRDIDEYNLGHILLTGSEDQKKLYANTLEHRSNFDISLHVLYAPSDPAALKLSITSILRRKGRVLEAMHDGYGALIRRLTDDDRKVLDGLRSVNGKIAALYDIDPVKLHLEQYQKKLKKFEATRDELEQEIARRSGEMRTQTEPVTLESVRRAIPKDAALVEIARYLGYDLKTDSVGNNRYVAYVLWADRGPAWVDLGDAV